MIPHCRLMYNFIIVFVHCFAIFCSPTVAFSEYFLLFYFFQVIDGIISIGDNFLSSKSATSKRKLEVLVQNVLDFLSKSNIMRGEVDANQRADGSIPKQPQIGVWSSSTFLHFVLSFSHHFIWFFWHFFQVSNANVNRDCRTEQNALFNGADKLSGSAVKITPDPGTTFFSIFLFAICFFWKCACMFLYLFCFLFKGYDWFFFFLFCRAVTPDCMITKIVEGRTHPTGICCLYFLGFLLSFWLFIFFWPMITFLVFLFFCYIFLWCLPENISPCIGPATEGEAEELQTGFRRRCTKYVQSHADFRYIKCCNTLYRCAGVTIH